VAALVAAGSPAPRATENSIVQLRRAAPRPTCGSDLRIFGPNDMRVLTPLGSLTLIPR
jgi:hypothetical protein